MPKKLMMLMAVLLIATGVLSSVQAQEAVEFPALTGEYQVGRAVYHMIDENREEIFTRNSEDDRREVVVTIYYPAEPGADTQPAPYVEDENREALSGSAYQRRIAPLPWDLIVSHAFADVPISEGDASYPVLLFSPGITMNPLFYTALIEEVTSHGYIVAALAHPYSVDAVVLYNGDITTMNHDGASRLLQARTEEASEIAMQEIGEVWVQDALFVLDQLVLLNENDPLLGGHMNLSQIGMFGHSFGGAASVEAAYRDSHILAVINIDGPAFGGVFEEGINQPFMMMMSDRSWQTTQEERFGQIEFIWEQGTEKRTAQATILYESSEAGYLWTLLESAHGTFSDEALLVPLGDGGQWYFLPPYVGRIDARRAHEITSTYIVAFFDKHVKGEEVPLLDGPSDDYPEVEFETRSS